MLLKNLTLGERILLNLANFSHYLGFGNKRMFEDYFNFEIFLSSTKFEKYYPLDVANKFLTYIPKVN